MSVHSPCKTLVIQPLPGIGDMVWYLPYIQTIARAENAGCVDVFTKKRSMADALFAADKSVAEVLWFEDVMQRGNWLSGVWRLSRLLKSKGYQRVWVLHESPRYALAAMLAGVPERFGYGLRWQKKWLNQGVYLPDHLAKAHPIDKANAYFACNHIALNDDVPKISLDIEKIPPLRLSYNDAPKPWVALGVGSSEPNRQWGQEKFAELTQYILQSMGGTVFVLGGGAEKEMAAYIQQAQPQNLKNKVVPLIAQPLNEVCALLSICDIFVGNDTGMLNASAATGVPSIGLFGAALSHRLADEKRNIYAVFADDTVNMQNKPLINQAMQTIAVQMVMDKIRQLHLKK